MTPVLEIAGLCSGYGHVKVLKDLSLSVDAGEIVALIGANGAGKTTLLMTIFGTPRASSGQVRFQGAEITGLPTQEIVRLGLALAPEGRRIFARMSVFENLQLGAAVADPKFFADDLARIYAIFPRLAERRGQQAGTMSGGEQQMLAIARALMSRPKLLLLDEPSLGLAPLMTRQIFAVIEQLNREQGMTILLVEQNAFHALRLAHRGYVLQNGERVLSGTGKELLSNREVRAAYLEGGHE